MPTENIQEFRSVGAWNVSFCAQFACGLTMWPKWPDQGAAGRTRGLQTWRLFCMMQDFPQSSEAVGLSQVSKMLRQLTGQISAHYSSSKIKKNLFTSFSSGPRTTYCSVNIASFAQSANILLITLILTYRYSGEAFFHLCPANYIFPLQ